MGVYITPLVTQVDGSGGTAPVNASRVVWSSGGATGRGTESIEGTAVTTTNAATQTLATLSTATGGPPIDTVYDYVLRVMGRDTAAAGFYRAEWRDTFERRTGVSAGIAVRQGPLPTVIGAIASGTLASASIDMIASTNDVLLRASPGATANVKWTWEIVALRNGV